MVIDLRKSGWNKDKHTVGPEPWLRAQSADFSGRESEFEVPGRLWSSFDL